MKKEERKRKKEAKKRKERELLRPSKPSRSRSLERFQASASPKRQRVEQRSGREEEGEREEPRGLVIGDYDVSGETRNVSVTGRLAGAALHQGVLDWRGKLGKQSSNSSSNDSKPYFRSRGPMKR